MQYGPVLTLTIPIPLLRYEYHTYQYTETDYSDSRSSPTSKIDNNWIIIKFLGNEIEKCTFLINKMTTDSAYRFFLAQTLSKKFMSIPAEHALFLFLSYCIWLQLDCRFTWYRYFCRLANNSNIHNWQKIYMIFDNILDIWIKTIVGIMFYD